MDTSNIDKYTCIGYTTNQALLLDLDYIDYIIVEKLADKYCRIFKLGGYLITQSSPDCHHIIFNRRLKWKTVCSMLAYICLNEYNLRSLTKWYLMQQIKGSTTLRIGTKGDKLAPKIIKCYGRQDNIIKEYLMIYEMFNKDNKHNNTSEQK